MEEEIWSLGDLTIEVSKRTVCRAGVSLQVSGLSFDLLLALVRAAPRSLSQDELIEQVWSGRVVNPETVAKRVNLTREALGDDASSPRYIGLVRGHGYRLLCHARRQELPDSRPLWSRPQLWGGALFPGVIVLLVLFFALDRPDEETASRLRQGIAVLPFANQSSGPVNDDFFADGIHDDIITELARLDNIPVISRTSVMAYRDSNLSAANIGRELNVDKILEGSVQRAGDKIRINVQLIDATSDIHIWAKSYQRHLSVSNIIEVQKELARDVARALKWPFSAVASQPGVATVDVRAYDLFLAARQRINRAIELKTRSDALDETYRLLGEAEQKLIAAVEADAGFTDAYAYLAWIYAWTYRNTLEQDQAVLNRSAAMLLRAVQLDADSPRLQQAFGTYYEATGDMDAAIRHMEKAASALPTETRLMNSLTYQYWQRGDFDKALATIERVTLSDPLDIYSWVMLGKILDFLGDSAGAMEAIERAVELHPESIGLLYAMAFTRYNQNADAEEYARTIRQLPITESLHQVLHWMAAFHTRDYRAALEVMQSREFGSYTNFFDFAVQATFTGLTHLQMGNDRLADRDFREARRVLQEQYAKVPEDPRLVAHLAQVEAALGNRDKSRQLIRQAQSLPRYRNNAHLASECRGKLGLAMLLNGDDEQVLEMIAFHFSRPNPASFDLVTNDPLFDRLRDDPRFLELKKRFSRRKVIGKEPEFAEKVQPGAPELPGVGQGIE